MQSTIHPPFYPPLKPRRWIHRSSATPEVIADRLWNGRVGLGFGGFQRYFEEWQKGTASMSLRRWRGTGKGPSAQARGGGRRELFSRR